ncbi:murein biosynthesis integral membrane protein MurJ [Candidatus Nomurabacteria bacterium]|nr:murein biosynthesis integral membrane protein MurJ [Candidatus Nomurabacteria bacterium]
MVKKIFTFLNKEFHGVNEAALLLGSFAFLSQILGLVRDRLLAHIVGAGPVLDIYYAAFRIPDLLYVSVASLASITVLMPFIVGKMKGEDGHNDARKFLNTIFSAFMICMLVVSIIVYILMPQIAHLIAPGFNPNSYDILVHTSRIMLLSPILIGFSNLIGTVTQLYKKFFVFSLSPVFYNIGIIIGIIFFYPSFGTYGLAYGVILGAIMHLAIQIPTVVSHNLLPRFTNKIAWREVISVIKISIPRTLTLSFGSITMIIFIALASKLSAGSISLFTFSFNLQSVPVGIIGISYSVAAFPILVRAYAKNDMETFRINIIGGIQQIIFWSLPIMAIFIVLRAQIVRVILGASTFSWGQTKLTAAAVALFIISLVSQSIVLLLVRGYYASGNTKKPLWINLFSSIVVVVLGFVILQLFYTMPILRHTIESLLRVTDVHGTEMLALPFAYAIGSLINVGLIWLSFRKDFFAGIKTGISRTVFQSIVATLVIGIISYFSLDIFDNIFSLFTFWGIFLQGFSAGVLGIIAGILTLHLMKNKEYIAVRDAMSHKFWKRNVAIPEQKAL